MRLTFLPLTVLLVFVATGCDRVVTTSRPAVTPSTKGSGKIVTERRDVAAFERLVVVGATNVKVTIAPERTCTLTIDDNILPLYTTAVQDNTLTITPTGKFDTASPIEITITTPDLTFVETNGAGSMQIASLDNDRFELHAVGAANVVATGRTDAFVFQLDGATTLDATQLIANQVDAEVRGAAKADVHAEQSLSVELAGVGSLTYGGDPQVSKRIRGLGAVTKRKQ
jgi:hypothetical protein